MFKQDEKRSTTIKAEQEAWERYQRKIQDEKSLEFRKLEALERIAEALESIGSAQWIR